MKLHIQSTHNLRGGRQSIIRNQRTEVAYLILGTADHEAAFPQPADRGSGVAEGRASQSDAAPLLGFYILRWRIGERGGS